MGSLNTSELGASSFELRKAKIVFFGNERLATGVTTTAPTLQALIAEGYDIKAVVSNYERGTSRNARELEIKEVADKHNIPVLLPDKPIDIIDQLRAFNAEAAVLVAYGRIVPQSVIDIFPRGIINIHPSLLPLHRGPIPLESVILNGEEKTGVSVMQLAKAMDAGPVYDQTEVVLSGTETKQDLANKLLGIGSQMVVDLLPGILDGGTIPKPQDDTKATYDKMISKEDGKLDWNKTAEQLVCEVRAYSIWPKSSANLFGKDVIITSAYAVPNIINDAKPGDITVVDQFSGFGVVTSNGTFWVDRITPIGKQEMLSAEFLRGYGNNQ